MSNLSLISLFFSGLMCMISCITFFNIILKNSKENGMALNKLEQIIRDNELIKNDVKEILNWKYLIIQQTERHEQQIQNIIKIIENN